MIYAYDAAGNVISVMDNTSGTNHIEYSNYTALGQPGYALSPKPNDISVKTAYTYDANMGRLSALVTQKLASGTPVATYQNLAYQYDFKGNITTLTDTENGITHAYTYDNLDRLLTATGTGQNPYSQTYAYDRIGNITSKSDVGNYAYTYGNRPHAVRTAGSISLQYDANGNMTQRSAGGVTLDLAWNENNKPSLIKRNGTDYVRLTYDGNGERVRKENLSTGAVTRYYGDIYEERGAIGVIHLFANNRRIVSIRSDGYLQYDHGNHLGSASVVTDAYSNRKETIEYFPFGAYRIRTDYDPAFPNVNYTFTDQEDDDETGLYNFKARLYDPLLGRFISADSIVPQPGNLQAFNRYSYCVNNPLVYVDPSGHFLDIAVIAIGAVIGALVAGYKSDWKPEAMAVGAVIGGVSGGVYSGVSSYMGGIIAGSITNATVAGAISGAAGGAAAGATAGAMSASYYGGNIGSAILKGAGLGAVGGAAFGAIGGYFGKTWNLWRVGACALSGGGVSELAGQGFEKGAIFAGITAFARLTYNKIVGYDLDWKPGGESVGKARFDMPVEGANNIGVQTKPVDPNGCFNEGGTISRSANYMPGVNATAGMHDAFQVRIDEFFGGQDLGEFARNALNVPGVLPAAALSYGGLMADPRAMMLYANERKQD